MAKIPKKPNDEIITLIRPDLERARAIKECIHKLKALGAGHLVDMEEIPVKEQTIRVILENVTVHEYSYGNEGFEELVDRPDGPSCTWVRFSDLEACGVIISGYEPPAYLVTKMHRLDE